LRTSENQVFRNDQLTSCKRLQDVSWSFLNTWFSDILQTFR